MENTTADLYPDDNGNFSDNFDEDEEAFDPNVMNIWLRVMWDSLFIIIIVVAIVGNLMVLWVISGKLVVFSFGCSLPKKALQKKQ